MAAPITVYVVDACALLAYLRDEAGKEQFEALLLDPTNLLTMHTVDLGEVYCITWRDLGETAAAMMLQDVQVLPIQLVGLVDEDLMKRGSKFKVENKISFADSFVLALAEKENGAVVSTDHHELDPVEQKGQVEFYWLR